MTVADWPSYLLRAIPQDTRAAMSVRAHNDNVSLADVVRLALCARYRMECDQTSFGYQPDLDAANDFLLIRLQPEVFRLMKKETRGRYGETKRLILQAIDDYLEAI